MFTLGWNFEPMTISHDYLGYRHAIYQRILALDSPHRGHSLEPLNILFAPFSRPRIHTFTLGWNFEPLTILHDYLGYRRAINKLIPGLDSPHREHSLEPLNVWLGTFLSSLALLQWYLLLSGSYCQAETTIRSRLLKAFFLASQRPFGNVFKPSSLYFSSCIIA